MISTDSLFDRLCQVLIGARGKRRAITLQEVANRLAVEKREVESIIETRYDELPFVLVGGAPGVWIPDSDDDLNAYKHSLHSRHRKLQLREARLDRKARAHGWVQLPSGRFIRPTLSLQQELFA